MKPSEIQFSLNLQALSAPQCRRIIEALMNSPKTQSQLSKYCKFSSASIDKHLEILIQAGLIKMRKIDGDKKAVVQRTKLQPTIDWFIEL